MANVSTLLTFRPITESDIFGPTGDWLTLRQRPYEERDTSGFIAWAEKTYGAEAVKRAGWGTFMQWFEEYKGYCDKDEFIAEIEAHKPYGSMKYSLEASRGEWLNSEPKRTTERKSQSFEISLQSSYTFSSENVAGIVCAQWEGTVYGYYGQVLNPKPDVEIEAVTDDDYPHISYVKLTFGQPVVGSLRVLYDIEYDLWELAIGPRTVSGDSVSSGTTEKDILNLPNSGGYGSRDCTEAFGETDEFSDTFKSKVRGIYSGGTTSLEVAVPDLKDKCEGEIGLDVEIDSTCYELEMLYHKCTGELLEENLLEVKCPDTEEADE